jgi:hypothetical protein
MKTLSVLQVFLTMLLLVAIGSCNLTEGPLPFEDEVIPEKDRGALTLNLNTGIFSAKTLAPPIAMEIGSYDIRGEGPDPAVDNFENPGNASGTLTRNGLKPGTWTIMVDARNPNIEGDSYRNGTIIGYGETTVLINAGAVTNAQIDITPRSGTGELSLAFQWTKGSVVDPSIAATLKPIDSDTPAVLDFAYSPAGNPEIGEHSNTAIEAGYYFLIFRFFSGTDLLWGTAEAVRILAGELTGKTFPLN